MTNIESIKYIVNEYNLLKKEAEQRKKEAEQRKKEGEKQHKKNNKSLKRKKIITGIKKTMKKTLKL